MIARGGGKAMRTPGPDGGARGRLILRLNEIWHDLENRAYDAKHPDILEEEIPRWRRILSLVFGAADGPRRVLDLGSGTGFVPLRLRELLRPGDTLTCSDLSEGMLEACRANVESAGRAAGTGIPFALASLKLDGGPIALPDGSQDAVTLNAVMHHLPDPAAVCREIDRILKPGGSVLIGHEPSATWASRRFLVASYWLMLPLADAKQFAYELILRLGWFEALRRPLGRLVPALEEHNRLVDGVNARLIAEGLLREPLSADAVSSLLDAQSPDAGGPRSGRGFSRAILEGYFPGYTVSHFESYNHLHKVNPRRAWMRRYSGWLARRHPEDGSSLFCVLEKPGN